MYKLLTREITLEIDEKPDGLQFKITSELDGTVQEFGLSLDAVSDFSDYLQSIVSYIEWGEVKSELK